MALKLWFIFITGGIHILKVSLLCAAKDCPKGNLPIKPFNGYCRVLPGETLCLVCPVNKSDNHVSWARNDDELFRKGHQVGIGNYRINKCHPALNSLEVTNIGLGQHHAVFTCHSTNTSNITAKFRVKIEVQTTLVKGSFDSNTSITTRSEITLKCVLGKSFGNVTLTWAINGNEVSADTYNYEEELNKTYISTFRYKNTGLTDNVTCRSSGPYVRDTVVLWLFESPISTEDPKTSRYTVIIVTSLLAICGAIPALYLFKRKCYSSQIPSLPVKIDSSETSEDSMVASRNQTVLYSQVAGKRHSKDDISENKIRVILEEQIQSTSKFDYWKGKWIRGPLQEKPCFAKTVNADTTLKNACDFKRLAESLTALEEHANIVSILSIFTDEVPYSIYYEHMAFGTLRDILISKYQQAGPSQTDDVTTSPQRDLKNQTDQLVSFSCDIAEAMTYTTQQNFSHPALSASKILLTQQGRCKLYDVYPTDMATFKITQVMNKKFPPVAWLAPETIFLNEYSCASDVWNFGIVLWEIFSIGDTPYKGMSQSQVEENIKQSIPLCQPPCCPGALTTLNRHFPPCVTEDCQFTCKTSRHAL